MNYEEFIKVIIEVVRDTAISDVEEDLIDPPGRSPSEKDVNLSKWYQSLGNKDIDNLREVIANAVDSSLFGILAVLDGARAIENQDKGFLELYYTKDENKTLLNNINDENLHDIYNRLTK